MYKPEDRPPPFNQLRLGRFSEDIIEWWRKERSAPKWNGSEHRDGARKTFDGYMQAIRTGHHWLLTPQVMEFIEQTDYPADILEGARLPFSNMAIEYIAPLHITLDDPERFPAPNRVIVVGDYSADTFFKDAGPGIVVGEFYQTTTKAWDCCPAFMVLPYRTLHKVDEWFIKGTNKSEGFRAFRLDAAKAAQFGVIPIPALGAMIDEANKTKAGLDRLRYQLWEMAGDMTETLLVTLSLLSLLQCQGLETDTVQPAPLTKKQLKRSPDKRPHRPEYRVLKLSASDHAASAAVHAGDRQGPRPHWRRGHIRRVHTALGEVRRWIKPTIVNAKHGEPQQLPVAVT